MKKIIGMLFVILIFAGCQNVYNFGEDKFIANKADGHELYYLPEFDELDSYYKIGKWIREHVKYDITLSDVGIWSNPKDTIESGKGTCADFAVLFINIAYFGMHEKGEVICGIYGSRNIENGGDINHAMVRFNNIIIEPQNGFTSNMNVGYYYTFDEIFN